MTEPIEDIIEITESQYKEGVLQAIRYYHETYQELIQTLSDLERKKDEGHSVKFYLNNKNGSAYYAVKEKGRIGYK